MGRPDIFLRRLEALKAQAAELRALGMLEVEVGGVRVVLAPPEPSPMSPLFDDSDKDTPPEPTSVLDDPMTFPGGKAPRRRVREEEDSDG